MVPFVSNVGCVPLVAPPGGVFHARKEIHMQKLLGNVEVSLGLRLKLTVNPRELGILQWAVNRRDYFRAKRKFQTHAFAWVFHSRVGDFPGFHASRVWHNPKTGHWHFSTRFSCNNFDKPVNNLLEFLAPIAQPDGFVGYIVDDTQTVITLVDFDDDGLHLWLSDEKAELNVKDFSELE